MTTAMLLRLLGTLAMLAFSAWLVARALRRTYPTAWARFGRQLFTGGVLTVVAGVLGWLLGAYLDARPLLLAGVFVVAALLVTFVLLAMSLPVWAGLPWIARVYERRAARTRARLDEPDPARRAFLAKAAGVVPVATAATGPVGTAASMMAPVVRRVDIPVRGLPPALEGLSLLQLTDVHLGTFIDVDQVERAIEAARAAKPDVVVLTGDIADDYDKLPAALDVVASLEPRLGAFAVYGNHEIYRGREACRAIYAASAVTLLCEEGVVLEKGGARLFLAGCDDPATLGAEHRAFLGETVRRSFAKCPRDVDVRVLLSHRPEGFEEAARQGVTLTLSGHTHGAQAALFGRSWLGWALPRNYLLGHYRDGESHLYTSAGLGHWFPFRLNCPCEVALVTLRGA